MNRLIALLPFIFYLLVLSACADDQPDDNGGGQTDNENTPLTVSVDPISVDEGNVDKPIYLSIRLSESSNESVSVVLATEDGSATANEDYVPLEAENITFSPGMTVADLRVDLLGDEEPEGNEQFYIKIVSAEGATFDDAPVTVNLENDDSDSSFFIPQTGYETPMSYPDMTMIWNDEFDSEESFDHWTFEIGNGDWGWGNNESQYYRSQNSSVVEGKLVIEAREEVFGGFQYTSSRMITRDHFDFQYGRVDIRAVLPEGQGIWPALWMLGSNITTIGWPKCGEIDIMELLGHDTDRTYGTTHWSNQIEEHEYDTGEYDLPNGEFNDEFHVFSMVWTESVVQFFVDDQLYHTVSITSADKSEFHNPFFFIFNVAVGGVWPGYPDETTTFPQRMMVDYIRVFQ